MMQIHTPQKQGQGGFQGNRSRGSGILWATPFWLMITGLSSCGWGIPPLPSSLSSAAEIPPAKGYQKRVLVRDLAHPWGMAWLPDGTILITERAGRLRIVRQGILDPVAIPGVPPVLNQGQAGLLDISLHPQFAQNRWVYFTYAAGNARANHTQLARAKFNGKALQDWQVIFKVSQLKPGTQHFGSRMLWLPDGTLLVGIGDGGNPPIQLAGDLIRKQAQNLGSNLGKILRLTAEGRAAANNPFVGNPQADPAVWSYGHRNIQGLAYDPIGKRVWQSEHGARGGDEINWVQAGKNYGWPFVSHSYEYFGPAVSALQSAPGMVDPRVVWTPSIAPSGLAFYTGDRFPDWQGDLFAGGLVSGEVRRIDLDARGNVLGQQAIAISARVRDVRQGPDGLLYVLTDDPEEGQLIRLEPLSR
jgi:aldose sugar dehydrogenase